jgi:hypothetical protein
VYRHPSPIYRPPLKMRGKDYNAVPAHIAPVHVAAATLICSTEVTRANGTAQD